jgi:hypothetical protein
LPSVNTTINGLNPFLDPVSREESSRAGGPALRDERTRQAHRLMLFLLRN